MGKTLERGIISQGAGVQQDWEGPLFVVGMPRSGTKLLRALLTQHPRIRIPSVETEFLPFLARWLERHGFPKNDKAFEELYCALSVTSYFAYRDPRQKPFVWRDWQRACNGHFGVNGLFEGFVRYEMGSERGSHVIWGDKSPTYLRYLDFILLEFPTARVIHIVRDVRDYCISIRKAWRKDVLRAAQRWETDVLAAAKILKDAEGRGLQIKYEELVENPRQQLQTVCSFLGVDFDERMLSLSSPPENIGDAKGRMSIVSGNHSKYRTEISSREQEAVEALAWNAMLEFGYQPEVARGPRHLSNISMALRKIKDGIRMVLHDVEGRGPLRSLQFYLRHRRTVR